MTHVVAIGGAGHTGTYLVPLDFGIAHGEELLPFPHRFGEIGWVRLGINMRLVN